MMSSVSVESVNLFGWAASPGYSVTPSRVLDRGLPPLNNDNSKDNNAVIASYTYEAPSRASHLQELPADMNPSDVDFEGWAVKLTGNDSDSVAGGAGFDTIFLLLVEMNGKKMRYEELTRNALQHSKKVKAY